MQTNAYGVVMGQSKPTKQHSGLGDHLGLLENASHTHLPWVSCHISAVHFTSSSHSTFRSILQCFRVLQRNAALGTVPWSKERPSCMLPKHRILRKETNSKKRTRRKTEGCKLQLSKLKYEKLIQMKGKAVQRQDGHDQPRITRVLVIILLWLVTCSTDIYWGCPA